MRISHVCLVIALAGCGMSGADGLRGSVADALHEDQIYLSATHAATTMPAMLDEVEHHVWSMAAILDDMGDHMSSMRHCSGIGPMADRRDDMRAEVDHHGAAMHALARMPDARDEVERHVGAMTTMLHDLDAMIDGMHCGGM